MTSIIIEEKEERVERGCLVCERCLEVRGAKRYTLVVLEEEAVWEGH
jgi:hypothetical protein